MSTNPIITLHDVGYSYRVRKSGFRFSSYTALKSISFDLYPGETLGLLGRNGAGKSTLLRLMANIYLPSQGQITFHKSKLNCSLLTLQTGFSPDLSGRDNAIMGALLYGYTKAEAKERLEDIIEFSGLGEWIDEPLKNYSAGMRARLGFTVAMEMAPDILLVDEILGVGDVNFQQKSSERIKSRIKSDQTVVLVTHSLGDMLDLSTRVVWLENGRVKMIGEPPAVIDAYRYAMTEK